MFGNNNDDNNTNNQPQSQDAANGFGGFSQETGVPTLPTMPAAVQPSLGNDDQLNGQQPQVASAPEPTTAPPQPADDNSTAPAIPQHHVAAPTGDVPSELVDIKQQALQHLSPLVSHLDQTPEEKFRTTMMMIQATDDQSLLKAAYEAAQKIEDDKARAQALLDVINEINYFTQQHSS